MSDSERGNTQAEKDYSYTSKKNISQTFEKNITNSSLYDIEKLIYRQNEAFNLDNNDFEGSKANSIIKSRLRFLLALIVISLFYLLLNFKDHIDIRSLDTNKYLNLNHHLQLLFQKNSNIVQNRKDLINYNISSYLNNLQFHVTTPFNSILLNSNSNSQSINTNIILTTLDLPNNNDSLEEMQDTDIIIDEYHDLGTFNINNNADDTDINDQNCVKNSTYSSNIIYQLPDENFFQIPNENLYQIRNILIKNDINTYNAYEMSKTSSFFNTPSELGHLDSEIIKKNWRTKILNSIWLSAYQCHLTLNEITYYNDELQKYFKVYSIKIFDHNWLEMKNSYAPFVDSNFPQKKMDLQEELRKIDKYFGVINSCTHLEKGTNDYKDCLIKESKNFIENKNRRDEFLRSSFISYPMVFDSSFGSILNINKDMDMNEILNPRLLKRKLGDVEEPVVIFNKINQLSQTLDTFAIFPHRFSTKKAPIKLNTSKFGIKIDDPQLIPFFTNENLKNDKFFDMDSINFIQSMNPLKIVKCNFTLGNCEIDYQDLPFGTTLTDDINQLLSNYKQTNVQVISTPKYLPLIKGQQFWLVKSTWNKYSEEDSLIKSKTILSILYTSDSLYRQELIIPLDTDKLLNVNINDNLSNNYLVDSEFISWDIYQQDSKTNKFDDFLQLSVTSENSNEQKSTSNIIIIKNILNIILESFNKANIQEDIIISENNPFLKGIRCLMG
ncbi:hypothetical protein TBLA_0G03700 [Henningerozyma blattae CBS 6284]|uniref:Uncharacterized protein n=1 Tax=Henningerozyma blattae (strain ATCC 34711 / CBS 6284 / DSM 70876 / NBRC 10599 / NRRL Y-10934 / UCD 77-7) TaxID=1071380 RepID=I2H7F1_HENB6|nr:hypothetical protein TBLA_0G03700 [Tetrapisispora blattae CBS 6284]CCH62303.1 hypothetical protein TBLA_0G03700 [Tetrapisispora blattae CBS 6284]